MKEKNRLFPITEEVFNQNILPVIEGNYIWKGRPPKISHYRAFCGILYIRTLARDMRQVFTRKRAGIMGKSSIRPSERERGCGRGDDNRQHSDEGSPPRRRSKRGRQSKETSRAGITAKFHAAITGDGRLVEGFLDGGLTADITARLVSPGIVGKQ
jgi:hypothetical protein